MHKREGKSLTQGLGVSEESVRRKSYGRMSPRIFHIPTKLYQKLEHFTYNEVFMHNFDTFVNLQDDR